MCNVQIQKPDWQQWKNLESLQKSKSVQKKIMSNLVIKQLNLWIFMTVL